MSRSPSPTPWRTLLASALLATLASWPIAHGQAPEVNDATKADDNAPKAAEPEKEKKPATVVAPTANRVYQRNGENRADIPIVLDGAGKDDEIVAASISGSFPGGPGVFRDGRFLGVPVGGPYTINVAIGKVTGRLPGGEPIVEAAPTQVTIGPVYVGDLWVLAGQSNMEGVGDLADVTPPNDRVLALGMDGKWARAEEPLHWLEDSPDEVHSGDPATRAGRSEAKHKSRAKGAGLGLPFGVVMAATTNVPVGLVTCAHGGTSLTQWSPEKKDEGGKSLYGSMLRQVKHAGGRARGVLWYQGESDALSGAANDYAKRFADFITAVRADLDDPDLPFYFVQIGRVVKAADPRDWNAVQEAQRVVAERVPNAAVVASIDLELDDLIHVGTQGLKRLGFRLARVAQRELFGQVGGTTPTLERVSRRGERSLLVKFRGVNRIPMPDGPPVPLVGGEGDPFGPLYAPRMPSASGSGQPLGGLRPARHIAGFSIRDAGNNDVPLIFDAAVGPTKDSVILKLADKIPDGASLYYGYGLNPYCNLTDGLDMAVPVFGPIALDEVK